MRHYVLTRSHYGPAWDLEANRRRLDVTRAVTAPLMAAQTDRAWTWIVLLDPTDPLLLERSAVFASAAPAFVPLLWTPPTNPRAAPWDRQRGRANLVQRIAAEAYRGAPWREAMGPSSDPAMMTRLDDDDGLAPDALARYRRAAETVKRRAVLMLPRGIRVWGDRWTGVVHYRNAMHTLVVPARDPACVYDYGHTKCRQIGVPVVDVDQEWGWIWVRHRDTISPPRIYDRQADAPITDAIRGAFPLDWASLSRAWTT